MTGSLIQSVHNNNYLNAVCFKLKTLQYLTENLNNQIPYEQRLGVNEKEKLPFVRKKPHIEPGTGRGSHLLHPG